MSGNVQASANGAEALNTQRVCFFLPVLLADPSNLCNFIMESLIFFDHLLDMNS